MNRFCCIIISMLIAVSGIDAARVYSFASIGNEAGLSSNCVKCILQDSYDFMWFGTKNGLDRYDGRTIKRYNCYDEKARRGNNNIGAVYEDKNHNLWIGTDRGVYRYDQRSEIFTFISVKSAEGVSADDWVLDIKGDKNGNIWVLVPNQGLFRFHEEQDDVVDYHRVSSNPGQKDNTLSSITTTTEGDVFVGTTQEGLFRYDAMLKKFRPVSNHSPIFEHLRSKTIQVVTEIGYDRLILLTHDGEVYRLNTKTLEIQPIEFSGTGKVYLRTAQAFDDEIWIGTQNGLYILNLTDRSERYITDKTNNATGLSDNLIYTIYNDRKHNVWLGTMFGGVNFYQREGFSFERFLANGNTYSIPSNRLRGMATSEDGKIYIGTEDSGICIFDPATGYAHRPSGPYSETQTSLIIKSFGNTVYSGVTREGIELFTAGEPGSRHIATDLVGGASSAYAVLLDKDGDLWVGADWGLFRRRNGSETFEPVKEIGNVWVFDLLQGSDGKIWIAGMGDGVWSVEPSTNKYRHYPYDEAHSNGLRSNSVSAIKEDSHGNIWVSTDRGGLSRYNPGQDNFTTYGIEHGFPDNVVYDVLEDTRGFLWFGTNKGLVKFNPSTLKVKVFTTADGLAGNQFNYHAAVVGRDGLFYFGSINGLIAFNPELDSEPATLAPVYFTNIKIGNSDVTATSVSEQSLMFTDKIEIPNDAHYITISVASPTYGNNGGVTYSYRLLPISEEWISIDNSRNISFASIAPGKYTLEVKASGDTAEKNRVLHIYVPSPWYRTTPAIITYVIIALLTGYFIYAHYRKRRETKLREREYMFKMQTEKELYENKVQFFSEVAHEIRTPLTLIQTPLEAIEEIGVKDSRVERYLGMMRKNVYRLLDLVSQLLDFQKVGNSRKKLNFEYVNVSSLVNDIASRFRDAITLRKKNLTLNLPEASVQAMIDKEAVTKIISNLLSNAMKYATSEIVATLTADGNNFTFRITSDGKKIEGEDVYSIFTPFYQIHTDKKVEGVGIGLPLSRMLASLHKGTLELEVDDTPLNTFRLSLPLQQEGVESPLTSFNPVMTDYVMDEEPQAANVPAGNSLLLVEDNPEMRDFLNEQLSRYFVIETAENGKIALDMLKENNYDIIVTDIMMPEMDGYEFCKAVKSDVEHSHIPVVFLTAKNDLDSKVQALKCGGEAYIEKPFSIKYFREQVYSLLENRRHERRSLVKKPFFTVDNMKMSKADEEFMNKVVQIIQDNISDENFNVETMADVMCMSRSSLLRKIKALFNLSPLELIRLVKLKKAAELIKEGKYRIGDICFMVGINSSSYFSKLFLKQFGITPKAFEMQCQKNARAASTPPAQPAPPSAAEDKNES